MLSPISSVRALLIACLCLFGAGGLHAAVFVPPATPRMTTSLDSGWRFLRADAAGAQNVAFDDSLWAPVTLPHTWTNLDGQDGGSNYYRGIGWYRAHLTVPAAYAGMRLFIVSAGAAMTADLYINGAFVGEHQGGFAAFTFDVTGVLQPGVDNVIAFKVSNGSNNNLAPLSGDFNIGGGLYRDVTLVATAAEHVSLTDFSSPGVYLAQSAVSAASANLQVTARLRNDSAAPQTLAIEADVVDADGTLVQTLTTSQALAASSGADAVLATAIAAPHLWDGRSDPHLYQVYVQVSVGGALVDVVQQPLGFRSYSVDPNTGFTLNGHALDLHGVDLHQDRYNKGWAISDADQVEDIGLISEIGATFVRLAHYQHPAKTYDLLDAAGIVAWSEVPFVNGTSGTAAFATNLQQQLQELIRQNFNHPSVCFWGMFNEIGDSPTERTLVQQLVALAHAEDPGRLTTAAGHQGADAYLTSTYTDVLGLNEYYGWYGGTYDQFGPWADGFHATYPNRALGISEYGAGASVFNHVDHPAGVLATHPEEYQALFHESYWQQIAARPWLWEKSVWNMFDFAVDSRNEGDTPGRNDKGLVTYDRQTRKDAFWWYKANWSASPVLAITDRRFTYRASASVDVKIYSNLDTVTLTVNGAVIGAQASANHIFIWPGVTLVPGDNLVQASGSGVLGSGTDQVHWLAPGVQTLTSVAVSPSTATIAPGATQPFTAVALDQTHAPMALQPGAFLWSIGSSQIISTSGVFSAGAASGGPYTVTATSAGIKGTASVKVVIPSPVITSPLIATATYGVPLSYAITATNAPTMFSAGPLPAWASINGNLITGTPAATGSWTIGISAGNAGGADTETLVLTVIPPPGPPIIIVAASAAPQPVTGKTAALAVTADDDGGEAALIYTWSTLGAPPAPVAFSPNGTNAAKSATATFAAPGSYNLQVDVADGDGNHAVSSVAVTVVATTTTVAVTPPGPSVAELHTKTFAALADDQFGMPMSPQPTFAWSVSGGGTISAGGVLSAGSSTGGPFTVTATGGSRSGIARFSVVTPGLPKPWLDQDFENLRVTGAANVINGLLAVGGSGADIGGTSDQGHFVYEKHTGDCVVIAHIASLQNTNTLAKVGVMIRDGLDPAAVNVFLAVTPGGEALFQRRLAAGGATLGSKSASGTAWLRLTRAGNVVSGALSTNGTTWTAFGTATVPMAATISVGAAVTSHDVTMLDVADFATLTVTP